MMYIVYKHHIILYVLYCILYIYIVVYIYMYVYVYDFTLYDIYIYICNISHNLPNTDIL